MESKEEDEERAAKRVRREEKSSEEKAHEESEENEDSSAAKSKEHEKTAVVGTEDPVSGAPPAFAASLPGAAASLPLGGNSTALQQELQALLAAPPPANVSTSAHMSANADSILLSQLALQQQLIAQRRALAQQHQQLAQQAQQQGLSSTTNAAAITALLQQPTQQPSASLLGNDNLDSVTLAMARYTGQSNLATTNALFPNANSLSGLLLGPAMAAAPPLTLTGRPPVTLYLQYDIENLSEYQRECRKCIELFEASNADLDVQIQGRNKPIVLGQVGIRCKACSNVSSRQRARASCYFPKTCEGLYQAAQNLFALHLLKYCTVIDPAKRESLSSLKDGGSKWKSGAGAGKTYWANGVRLLGVYEDVHGLRFKPLGTF